jgi:hypothetical protein
VTIRIAAEMVNARENAMDLSDTFIISLIFFDKTVSSNNSLISSLSSSLASSKIFLVTA